ncbi:MAG: hypothetical protein IJY41_00235 [Clostridia bacterium]|nr:hypothetical protein [Clostridia bacterium]
MKIILVTDNYTYESRGERIFNLVDFFSRQGKYEFIAFDIYKQRVNLKNLHILKVNQNDTPTKCISYVKGIIGDERFVVIYERYVRYIDLKCLLDFHMSHDFGISVCALDKKENRFSNSGIFVIENEYLDLIENGYEPHRELCIYCAERNDLGIFEYEKKN